MHFFNQFIVEKWGEDVLNIAHSKTLSNHIISLPNIFWVCDENIYHDLHHMNRISLPRIQQDNIKFLKEFLLNKTSHNMGRKCLITHQPSHEYYVLYPHRRNKKYPQFKFLQHKARQETSPWTSRWMDIHWYWWTCIDVHGWTDVDVHGWTDVDVHGWTDVDVHGLTEREINNLNCLNILNSLNNLNNLNNLKTSMSPATSMTKKGQGECIVIVEVMEVKMNRDGWGWLQRWWRSIGVAQKMLDGDGAQWQ
jgi:hypothetical protein